MSDSNVIVPKASAAAPDAIQIWKQIHEELDKCQRLRDYVLYARSLDVEIRPA